MFLGSECCSRKTTANWKNASRRCFFSWKTSVAMPISTRSKWKNRPTASRYEPFLYLEQIVIKIIILCFFLGSEASIGRGRRRGESREGEQAQGSTRFRGRSRVSRVHFTRTDDAQEQNAPRTERCRIKCLVAEYPRHHHSYHQTRFRSGSFIYPLCLSATPINL